MNTAIVNVKGLTIEAYANPTDPAPLLILADQCEDAGQNTEAAAWRLVARWLPDLFSPCGSFAACMERGRRKKVFLSLWTDAGSIGQVFLDATPNEMAVSWARRSEEPFPYFTIRKSTCRRNTYRRESRDVADIARTMVERCLLPVALARVQGKI